jgi:hypothetical protein
MASYANMEKIAQYAFMAFVVIAIIAGLAFGAWAYSINNNYPNGFYDSTWSSWNSWILLIMLILGIIVGLVSITTTEVAPFLTAAIALIVASLTNIWDPLEKIHALLPYWVVSILTFIVAFVAPAAVILAIKGVYALARKK